MVKVKEVQNSGKWHWRGNSMHPDSGPLPVLNPSAYNTSPRCSMAFSTTSLNPSLNFSLFRKALSDSTFYKLQPPAHQWHSLSLLFSSITADNHLTYYIFYIFICCLPLVRYWLHGGKDYCLFCSLLYSQSKE